MSADIYRSYVIRVRRRRTAGDDVPAPVHLDVEDLLGGGRAEVAGERARLLADDLAALVGPPPDPGADTERQM